MSADTIRTRFAPSPTGLLHLGNIRTALFNYLLAKKAAGTFLLRVEDTDIARGHEDHVAALQQDLCWLGLQWQEGLGVGGERGPYRQSQRGAIYGRYFDQLERSGRAYPCFCSEQELALERKAQIAAGRPPRYSGRCYRLSRDEMARRLAAGTPASLRFHVETGGVVEFDDKVRERQRFATDDIGDFVIRRSSGAPAFFFSNAVDDALMGVTVVVRGDDHLSNTPRQILILKALALPIPEYAHIALVVSADNAPLSKRSGSRTVRELREAGFLPIAIANYLARLGHGYESNALLDLDGLAAGFDLRRVSRSPARFDEKQLLHWQREAVRATPEADLLGWMGQAVRDIVPADKRDAFVEAVRANLTTPGEALEWARIIFTDDDFTLERWAQDIIAQPGTRQHLETCLQLYREKGPEGFGRDPSSPAQPGIKRLASFVPARAALTGRQHGPQLRALLGLMLKERVQKRLQEAIRSAS